MASYNARWRKSERESSFFYYKATLDSDMNPSMGQTKQKNAQAATTEAQAAAPERLFTV